MSIQMKKITKSDMRVFIENYDMFRKMCIICEIEDEEGKKMLIRLWNDIYVYPDTNELYQCECILGTGTCRCEYNEAMTKIYKKSAEGGIRII